MGKCFVKSKKIYVRPHLNDSEIFYHKYDPEKRQGVTNKLEQVKYTTMLRYQVQGKVQVDKGLSGNWVGKPFIKGDGIDACIIFSNKIKVRPKLTCSVKSLPIEKCHIV